MSCRRLAHPTSSQPHHTPPTHTHPLAPSRTRPHPTAPGIPARHPTYQITRPLNKPCSTSLWGLPKWCVPDPSAGEATLTASPSLPAPSGRVTPLAPPTRGASPLATLRVGDGGWTGPAPHLHNSTTLRHKPSRRHLFLLPQSCSVIIPPPPPPFNLTTTPTHHRHTHPPPTPPPPSPTPSPPPHPQPHLFPSPPLPSPLPPPLPLSYPPAHPLPGRRLERGQAQLNHGLLYLK